MTWRICLAAALVLAVGRCAAQEQSSSGDDKDGLGRAAVAAYTANINAFPFYKCRYTTTKGEAKSVEDAVRGKLLNAVSYDSRLLVDGPKDMYEGLSPPVMPNAKSAKPVPGRSGVSIVPGSAVDSDRYLADGKREINYVPQMRLLGLWSNDKCFRGIHETPLARLSVGHRNTHGPNVMLSQPDRFEMISRGLQEIDGRPVIAVRFKYKEDAYKGMRQFSFDVGRGHLPIRVSFYDSEPPRLRSQTFVTDVRECSGQRWFPERIVIVNTPDRGDVYSVTELKMLEFDADRRPDAAEFTIEVPAGTSVSDQHDESPPKKPFRLKQDEKVNVDDLPRLFAMMDQAQVQPLMDTAIPHGSRYAWLRWPGLALALVGLMLLVRWRVRRLAARSST